MEDLKGFEEFLASTSTKIPIADFIFNFIIATVLALVLSWIYVRYGKALSNRKGFARNFVLLTLITMLIISIVKSSLALSLGLVGALSIVRFRAAIKDPEELMYLFFAIAIGLGMGANQGEITLVAFVLIVLVIAFQGKLNWKKTPQNLHLSITSEDISLVNIEAIIKSLELQSDGIKLQRYDYSNNSLEASLLIEINNYQQFIKIKNNLESLGNSINFTLLDNKNIF